jgi:hypothetical protein
MKFQSRLPQERAAPVASAFEERFSFRVADLTAVTADAAAMSFLKLQHVFIHF